MARIRLIRHGEAAASWGAGEPDPGLSDAGRVQARAAALRLMRDAPTRLLTSPLRRCRETAAALGDRLEMEAEAAPQVAEVPTPPGLLDAERQAWLRIAFATTWAEITGGDYEAWRHGVAAFVAGLEDGTAVFTHFVAINAAVSVALGEARTIVFRPANASITTVEAEGGRLRVVELGAEAETQVL